MVDVLIFAGQSNMQGQSDCLSENAPVMGAKEYKFFGDELVTLQNPVGENIRADLSKGWQLVKDEEIPSWVEEHVLGASCYGHTNLVPAFCRAYIEKTGKEVVAVHTAKGSTQISSWVEGGAQHQAMMAKAKAALKKLDGEIGNVYFIWLQGESDALASVSTQAYVESITALKNCVKRELGVARFGIIKVGRFAMDERDEEIFAAQEEVCEKDKDFLMLTRIIEEIWGKEGYMNPYQFGHYSAKGLETIGACAGAGLAEKV